MSEGIERGREEEDVDVIVEVIGGLAVQRARFWRFDQRFGGALAGREGGRQL